MAFLNIFKKKKIIVKKEKAEKPSQVEVIEKPKTTEKVIKKEFSQIAYKVLKSPHLTEKATNLVTPNKYIFKVIPKANKIEIKKAIQDLYGVKVRDVNLINIPKKRRRLSRTEGWKAGYKKAVVTLAEGEKIEINA